MADALFVVLRKVALSLGERVMEKLGAEVVEAASVLTDFEHSMKQIESEFMVLQAFISQVSAHKVGDRTFDAWLDQVRDVAHEVEDITDEYAYVTAQSADASSFFKRKFHQIKHFAAWQNISTRISQVETRIQRLTTMRNRYGISVGELDRNNMLQPVMQPSCSDAAYLIDNSEIMGNTNEIARLTKWLLDEKQDRAIMSIFGMGGIGKTTIASSIYRNKQIRRTFDCYAWITLSQSYQVDDLLRQIIKQITDQIAIIASGIETMSHIRLTEVLQTYLKYKKYIIVLDDIWDKDAWLFLNYAFVRNHCGSRVLITTRQKDIASLADDKCVVELKTLPYAEAWELFCMKAFRASEDDMCPANLQSWAEKIVDKCQGLPLAIVAVGSLLSFRESEEQEWKSFYNQLSWQLANNPELNWMANVLNLSLNDLPSYLKCCFLYCSLFPEDYKIKRKWIAKLWIAEGLVEERGAGTTMEEVAECHLRELVQRSLLKVIERNAHGRAKSFQMHDLVREVSLIVAKKERFAIACGNDGMTQIGSDARRLSIQKGAESVKIASGSQLRSFILFDMQVSSSWIYDISSNLRLIKVLCLRFANIEKVPSVVTDLLNLHYLDLAYTKVKHIPASIGKLRSLQVLDLRYSYVERLPCEISALTKLRHLHVYMLQYIEERAFECFTATRIPVNICHLKNLQALQTISANKDLVSQLGNLTLMRSLAIMKIRQSYIAELWDSLTKMPRLSRLVISASDKDEILHLKKLKPLTNLKLFWLIGRLDEGVLPPIFASFEKLSVLKMVWSGLREDPINSFSHMLNLVGLHLHRAYDGERLTFQAGWFPKLHTLELAEMENLNLIEIKDGTMNVLQQLDLMGLRNLKAVPEGIKYIRTLQEMLLTYMPKEFIDKLQGDDSAIVQHIPNIRNLGCADSQAAYNRFWSLHLETKYGSGARKYAASEAR